MRSRVVGALAVLALGSSIGLAAFLLRPSPPPPPVPSPPTIAPAPTPPPPTSPSAPPAASPTSSNPVLALWQTAIRNRDEKGVMKAQGEFLAREGEYRAPLTKMAKEDADPRIRAFSVAALGRMKAPPPEAFFLERLDDASEHPRRSALHALEKLGTAAALSKIDRLASSDPVESVRIDAAKAAKAVRSR